MKCHRCGREMDEESREFCEEYNTKLCLNCLGAEWVANAREGKWYHIVLEEAEE